MKYCQPVTGTRSFHPVLTLALGPRAKKADKSPSGISSPQLTGFLFSIASSLSFLSLGVYSLRGGLLEPGGSKICEDRGGRVNGRGGERKEERGGERRAGVRRGEK
jgi:hypothetical protein